MKFLFNFIFAFLTFVNVSFSQGIVTYMANIGDTTRLFNINLDFGISMPIARGYDPPSCKSSDEYFKGVILTNTSSYPLYVEFEIYTWLYWDLIVCGNSDFISGVKYKFCIPPHSRLYVKSKNRNIIKIYKWVFLDNINFSNKKSLKVPRDVSDGRPFYYIFQDSQSFGTFYHTNIIRA